MGLVDTLTCCEKESESQELLGGLPPPHNQKKTERCRDGLSTRHNQRRPCKARQHM
jgi:hypothetical protein